MNREFTVVPGGILAECFQKVRDNFYNNIDEHVHAATYEGCHDIHYAEPEFTGKFLDICAYYYETEADERALKKGMTVVDSICCNQREDGYLGCLEVGNEQEAFSIWNHGFTMYGLARMCEALGDGGKQKKIASTENACKKATMPQGVNIGRVRQALVKAADWLLDTFTGENAPDILDATNDGSQHISCFYALTCVYNITKDPKYLDFIRRILDVCETTDMNLLTFTDILKLRSRKGIEMLVIYLGVLQYGLLTKDERAVQAAKRYWQQVNDTQIRNTGNGTVVEKWTKNGNAACFMPTESKPNETCVAVGWIELSLALFHVEQRAEYLDAIEKTLFNHMVGSLEKNGADLAYYQGNYGKKIYRTDEGAYQCCRYRGFTIFSYLKEYLYYVKGDLIIPMVYGNSQFLSEELSIKQETQYPSDGTVCFTIENNGGEKKLYLRVPGWCNAFEVDINGKQKKVDATDGYLVVLVPMGYSSVRVRFVMEVLFQSHEGISPDAATGDQVLDGEEDGRYVSATYGPLLLALDTHYGNELWSCVDTDKEIVKKKTDKDTLVHFTIDGVHLIDFASAGGITPGKDEYTVFIKKVVGEP